MARDWWKGNEGAPTVGYGAFDARPAAREATPMLDELITGEDEPVEEVGQIEQQNKKHYETQMRTLQLDLNNLQLQLSMETPGSMGYNRKLNQIKGTQAKLRNLQIQFGS
jgi:hypothetical protein